MFLVSYFRAILLFKFGLPVIPWKAVQDMHIFSELYCGNEQLFYHSAETSLARLKKHCFSKFKTCFLPASSLSAEIMEDGKFVTFYKFNESNIDERPF